MLGYELHQSLGLKAGGVTTLLGERFTVQGCHEERGGRDDITAWIPLEKAQQLLGKEGKINAIMALQCLCKDNRIAHLRSDITGVLPNTQVLELGTERRLARLEARVKVAEEAQAAVDREKVARADLKRQWGSFASLLVAVAMISCIVWLAVLTFSNVRERQSEIGVFLRDRFPVAPHSLALPEPVGGSRFPGGALGFVGRPAGRRPNRGGPRRGIGAGSRRADAV